MISILEIFILMLPMDAENSRKRKALIFTKIKALESFREPSTSNKKHILKKKKKSAINYRFHNTKFTK